MNALVNHKALVVGASRGIGRAIAVELASQGASLGLMARHQAQLKETAELCHAEGAEVLSIPVDVTEEEAATEAFAHYIHQQKTLDILILCQGVIYRSLLVDDHQKQWKNVLKINLLSHIHLTQLALPYLLKNNEGHQRAIIFVSSIAGKQAAFPGISSYCASKFGLVGFAHAIFEEVRESGLKVSVLCPGYVNTDMVNREPNLNFDKMTQPSDLAKLVSDIIHTPVNCCPVEVIIRPQFSPVIKR